MGGFAVTPAALHTAAQAIERLAQQTTSLDYPVLNAAEAAATANPQYLTATAGIDLAGQLTAALTTLTEALTTHAASLRDTAATYRSTEDRDTHMIDQIQNGLPAGPTPHA